MLREPWKWLDLEFWMIIGLGVWPWKPLQLNLNFVTYNYFFKLQGLCFLGHAVWLFMLFRHQLLHKENHVVFIFVYDISLEDCRSFCTQDTFVPSTSSSSVVAGSQKKKRTKVTDTRLSPRVARALLQDGFYHRIRPSLDLISRKQQHQQLPADLSVWPVYWCNYVLFYSIIFEFEIK